MGKTNQDAVNTANNQTQSGNVDTQKFNEAKQEIDTLRKIANTLGETTNLQIDKDKGATVPTPQTSFVFEDAKDNDTFALALAEGCVVDFTKAKLQNGYRVENGVKDPNPFPSVAAGGYRFPLKAVASILQPEGNSKNDIEVALRLLGKRKLREYSRGEYDQVARKYTKQTVWSWSSEMTE